MSSVSRERSTTTRTEHSTEPVRPVAVIDIGATSVRLAIAEIHPSGEIRTLEKLTQGVSLGKDTFTGGSIKKRTIEECVKVLKSYQTILEEYGITRPEQIRMVGTSALREANNRLAFQDRIFSATGLTLQAIEEAEVNRVTFLGVQPLLKSEEDLADSHAVVIEVGGGSTEVLLVHQSNVLYSHSYRLGALRLREILEAYRAPTGKFLSIMETQIQQTVEQVLQHVPTKGTVQLVALGGDVRFAAWQLQPGWGENNLARLKLQELEQFTNQVATLSIDQLVRKYHLTYPVAESLSASLLTYVKLARGLGVQEVVVTNVNLRDGLLKEMATDGIWTDDLSEQIIRSTEALAEKFDTDSDHSEHVARLAKLLFYELRDEHRLGPKEELFLYLAALLHEVGLYISQNSSHKHTKYLIEHSELFGLSKKDLLMIALIARYHRRASPKPNHDGFSSLNQERRIAVSKLAAILRVADALDRSRSRRVDELIFTREKDQLVISIPNVDDLSLEQLALKQKGPLFEEIFGMRVLLRGRRR